MANLRSQFERELRQKLQQKATTYQSEEALLVRAFKYFDLDNSNSVSREEWRRAIEKIGVTLATHEQLDVLFDEYDTDHSGVLDYKEFSAVVTDAERREAKNEGLKRLQPHETPRAEQAIRNLREKLATRGARGLIGLARQFKIMDDDNSHSVDFYEFSKAIKDYRVDVPESDLQLLFTYVDRDGSGSVDYEEFLRAITGEMNAFRKALVTRAFDKLDSDQSGILDITDIKHYYNARAHPDVKAGRKTEEDVLSEFLDTFEMHHNLGARGDRRVTREEFEEYYNNVSASIDNDQYFELMMNNAWKLTEAPAYTKNKAWSNVDEEAKATGFGKAPERARTGKGSAVEVPNQHRSSNVAAYGVPRPAEAPSRQNELLFERFRSKLAARGSRGIIGIGRQFKIIDDDNSGMLSLGEFQKACKDFRVDMEPGDVQMLFNAIDRDRSGEIDYDELLRSIRGPMNAFRQSLVAQAWRKLDRDGNGVLELNDIKGVYSARRHPDVRSGKKTEEDVLGEFLETFETHHNISNQTRNDRVVTQEEFTEYYNNVSASIDDDKYFETMMMNAWNLLGESPQKAAWAGANGSKNFQTHHKSQWIADHHRSLLAGGSVSASAPYGTSEEPTDWSTSLRPKNGDEDLLGLSEKMPTAGAPSWPGGSGLYRTDTAQIATRGGQAVLDDLRQKLLARGARGILGLQRQFRIIDDNHSQSLDFDEFVKGLHDFRVAVNEEEARILFNMFDNDRSGAVDYEEFLHRLKGPMNEFRLNLVRVAFQKLDKSGDGTVTIEDIKGVYNATKHPDVRTGKKTEDEVLSDFLDTFDMHHNLYVSYK
jgi:Ca2+-binding EF-hand superfamily protein